MKRFIGIMLCMSLYVSIQAAVKGSFTQVSNEPFYTFLSTDTDNTIQGFAEFNDGFALEDNTTVCTFNGFFPVSGTVALNGGTLLLEQDLIFKNVTDLQSWGTIYGNDHIIELCQTINEIPSNGTSILNNASFVLANDVSLSGTLLIQGNCTIVGDEQRVVLGDNAVIIIDSGATLHLRNVTIQGITASNIVLVDDSSSLYLHLVRWIQTEDVTFDTGSITFSDSVDFIGSSTFFYESSQSSTILQNSRWILDNGMQLSIGRQEIIDIVEPLIFIDQTSKLVFDNSSLMITDSGIGLTKGTIEFVGSGNLDIVSTVTSYGLIMGDGNAANDFTIFFNAGSVMNFNRGYLVYNNAGAHQFVTASQDARVIRYPDSLLYVATNWVQPSYTLQISTASVPQLLLAPGVEFSLENTQLNFPQVQFNVSAQQPNAFTFLLNGGDSLDFTRGSFPLPIVVANASNQLSGNANIIGPVVFADASAELEIALLGGIAHDITLNGGTIMLERDLTLSDGAVITTEGTLVLDSHTLDLPSQDTVWSSSLVLNGNTAIVNFNGNVDLSGTWTIEGACIFNGTGTTLNLAPGGQIVVTSGSSLIIRNMQVIGLHGSSLQCWDDSASLVLDNVTWMQDGDFAFSNGSILFKNFVHMFGENVTFAYQSGQTSTVAAASIVYLDNNFTFSYDPIVVASQNLLAFANRTSSLQLDGATLHITQTGMQMTVGELRIISDSSIRAEQGFDEFGALIVDQGLILGDCVNPDNDMRLYIVSGATMHIYQGNLSWKNLVMESLKMPTLYSTLNIENNAELFLYQNFYGNGYLNFFNNIVVGQAPGVSFGAQAVAFYGPASFIDLPSC